MSHHKESGFVGIPTILDKAITKHNVSKMEFSDVVQLKAQMPNVSASRTGLSKYYRFASLLAHYSEEKEHQAHQYSQIYEVSYPTSWKHQTQPCELFDVCPHSKEYETVSAILSSMPMEKLHSIQRIQNKHLWKRYFFERQFVKERNGGICNEMTLFYASLETHPEEIYNSGEGFDMRYATNGSQGTGVYFADTVGFAFQFAYVDEESSMLSVILSKVLIENPLNRINPHVETQHTLQTSESSRKLNSGMDSSSPCNIYAIHSNCKAYPSYLISVSLPDGLSKRNDK